MNISAWLRLSRIEHAAMVFIAIIISEILTAFLENRPHGFSMTTYWIDLVGVDKLLISAIGPFLIAAGAFILNDYFGLEADRANNQLDRPIVAGKIKKQDALKAAYLLFAFGLMASFLVNFACFVIALIFTFLSAIYDNYLKKLPLIGNVFIASSMSISFIYGNFATGYMLQDIIMLFAIISFLAGVGRELIITLRDIQGDRKIGAKTLPMLIGTKWTLVLSSGLFFISIILSWVPIILAIRAFERINILYAIFIAINNILLIYCILLLFKNTSQENFKKARDYSLMAMLLGLIAFGSLAI